MSSKNAKTPERLQQESKHVLYEWNMFDGYIQWQTLNNYQRCDRWLDYALLTDFSVHTRNLLDFFYPSDNIQDTDLLARDYFDHPGEWKKLRPEETETLKKTRGMVNKLTAHLTEMRVTWSEAERSWEWVQIYIDLSEVWHRFVNNVAPEKLSSEINSRRNSSQAS